MSHVPPGHEDAHEPLVPPLGNPGSEPVIAVDAMGGDYAPDEIVAGALAAQREHRLTTLLTGPPARLRPVIARLGGGSELRVVPAEDVVGMGEGALAGLRRPRSSIAVACQLVRRGQASAVVSAGSTGAIVASARHRLLPLPSVPRPGLAVVLPTYPKPTVLIDAGATADPKPEMLVQFGHLGVAYAQIALGTPAPKVGLLTIGAEPGKGNALTRRAHELLAAEPQGGGLPLYFAGNIEGGDLMAAAVDVIVTDGFTGNVALKTLEGAMRFAASELRTALTQHPGGPPGRRPAAARAARAQPPPGAGDLRRRGPARPGRHRRDRARRVHRPRRHRGVRARGEPDPRRHHRAGQGADRRHRAAPPHSLPPPRPRAVTPGDIRSAAYAAGR